VPTVNLTQAFVKGATHQPTHKQGRDRTIFWDEGVPGFGLVVTATGHKSFVYQYRVGTTSRRLNLDGQFLRLEAAHTAKSGRADRAVYVPKSPFDAARREAAAVRSATGLGRDPLAEVHKARNAAAGTLKAIAESYLAREGKNLRSARERKRIFNRYIYPKLGNRQIDTIKRSDVVKLLDRIEDENGPVMADHVLAVLRRLMSWHASRDDDFRSPIVRGMGRTKPKERARKRKLSDDEIRALWACAEASGSAYAHMLQFILLTATRIKEASCATRAEFKERDWTIPAARHKSKLDFLCPLSSAASDMLHRVPRVGRKGWVFTTDGETPISGFSKWKRAFDAAMLVELRKSNIKAELERWTVHDLRRTARSLMSRAGIDPDHAERALGHVVGGVRGVYDRHEFKDEKAAAFEALAHLVSQIINPKQNVVALPIQQKRRSVSG